MRLVIRCVIALALLGLVPAAQADVRALSAVGFSGSVGVDTHVVNGNTAYGDWPRVVAALNELGVRHVSDSVYGNPSWVGWNAWFQSRVEYAAAHGIRFAFEMGLPGWNGGTIDQLVGVLSGPLRNAVEAVEEPIEWDMYGPVDFASRLAAYDRQLYGAVKASPSLRSLPVVGPPVVSPTALAQLGNQQRWLDVGAIHPYLGGDSSSPRYTASQLRRGSVTAGHKPLWATEMGYTNALNAPGNGADGPPVSEAVAAVYLLREYLENFKSGIARSYAYELIDEFPDPSNSNPQQHYGLLRNNYTPKPAYYALKNLLTLVGYQAPPKLTPLQLSITQAPSDLQQLVLQQSPHHYLIVLWRLASIWNPTTRQPINVTPTPITLKLPTATSATTANPITTSTPTPLTLTNHQTHIQIGPDPTTIQIETNSTS